jgi:hypothetical protein
VKNFDVERKAKRKKQVDRSFTIAGEMFFLRSAVRPEVLALMDTVDTSRPSEVLAAVDAIVLQCITKKDRAKWIRVRTIGSADPQDILDKAADPNWQPDDAEESAEDELLITMDDLVDVMKYCVEEMSGRPTEQPADSTAGQQATGTFSTVGSDSSEPTPQTSTSDDS